jgi:hypothetical protein
MNMGNNETRRIDPKAILDDKKSLSNVKAMSDYHPAKAGITVEAADSQHTAMTAAQEAEAVAKKAWEAARDAATQAEWDFHNFMLEVKQQVVAQYGDSSDQAQAVGLKKKSEYKKPSGRKPGGASK